MCCEDSTMCCSSPDNSTDFDVVCDGVVCPRSLPASEVYDGEDQLRNECCMYFRGGCCSSSENSTLDLL